MSWQNKYSRLLFRLQLAYLIWILVVSIGALIPGIGSEDPALRILGKSLLYFLPLPIYDWANRIIRIFLLKGKRDPNAQLAILANARRQLEASLHVLQIAFISLIIIVIIIAMTSRSTAAIWVVSLGIQVAVVLTLQFTEQFFTSNLLREVRNSERKE